MNECGERGEQSQSLLQSENCPRPNRERIRCRIEGVEILAGGRAFYRILVHFGEGGRDGLTCPRPNCERIRCRIQTAWILAW